MARPAGDNKPPFQMTRLRARTAMLISIVGALGASSLIFAAPPIALGLSAR